MALIKKHTTYQATRIPMFKNHDIIVAECQMPRRGNVKRMYRIIDDPKELSLLNYAWLSPALYAWDKDEETDMFWELGKSFNSQTGESDSFSVMKIYRCSSSKQYKSIDEIRKNCTLQAMVADTGGDYNLIWRK